MSLRDEPQAPRLRAPRGSACEDTWHQRTPDRHTDHQAVFAFAILLGHAGVLRPQGVRSAARPRQAGLWRWASRLLSPGVGYLGEVLGAGQPHCRGDGRPAQDFGLAGPGGLDATWEVGLPGGKRQKVAFDDDESDPGSMPRTYTSGGSWAPSRGTLLGNPPLSTMVAARNRHLSQALTWVLRQHARDLGIANNDEDWRAAPGKKPKGRILEVTRTCPKRRREISRDGLLIRSVPPPPAGTR